MKKKIKISKERIPSATQLFTPDWIVKYMVENSLGRLWLEGHPNKDLQSKWKYYVPEAEQDYDVYLKLETIKKESSKINPEDIKVIDPCMGSGHILVYVFDVLMDIYISEGYTEKDATISIIENNIYGLDIDDRAYQLSYFAIMMKARSYNRRILNKNIKPHLTSIKETNEISNDSIKYIISKNSEIKTDLLKLIDYFNNAKNYGSILKISDLNINLDKISNILNNINMSDLLAYSFNNELKLLKDIVNQVKILKIKYDVVITNPPYMGNNSMNIELKNYIKSHYPLSKTDLFAVSIEKGFEMIKENRFNCMVTMQSWMFLSSFEKFRKKLLDNITLINLLHMDNMVMKIAFGTSATIFRKTNIEKYNGTYYHVKLSDVNDNSIVNPAFFNDKNIFTTSTSKFKKIPGTPIAYWPDNNLIECFNNTKIEEIADVKQGLATADNKRFLRYWFEVDFNKISFSTKTCQESETNGYKWFPYNKGGNYVKWWGNQEYIVNWENNGYAIKNNKNKNGKLRSRPQNTQFYFKESISWSKISSGKISFRYYPNGFIFDVAGCSIFPKKDIYYILGFLNSNISSKILNSFSQTLNYEVGQIKTLPIILNQTYYEKIVKLVNENIKICKENWDNHEISWNFKKHPILKYNQNLIKDSFELYKEYTQRQFDLLKNNEIKLNKFFSEIYNINDNINIENKHISVNIANYEKTIKSYISYAVGCIFGRYNIDNYNQISTTDFNMNNYNTFIPDEDNIIPVLDTEYFEDDIVGRFIEFVKICFNEEHLEENLDFIAKALNNKGKTSREIIRNYFLNDFINDHIKMYRKRPIYWQFDSGKQNGFKCLIYMHRYNPGLVAKIRTDYLHKTQKAIEESINNCSNIIENSDIKSEVKKADKLKNKLLKQLDETRGYDGALAHIANQKIEIDLDDGIKINYAKFQNIKISNQNNKKTKKMSLLKKID